MPTLESTVEAPVTSTTTTEANGHAPKAPKAAKAKKTVKAGGKGKIVKKAAKPAKVKKEKKAKTPKGERGPSKTQIECLKALNKGEMSRGELADQLETFVGGKIMGHADPKLVKPTSLVGRGLARMKSGEPRKLADGSFSETEGAHVYEITAAGKKFLESLK